MADKSREAQIQNSSSPKAVVGTWDCYGYVGVPLRLPRLLGAYITLVTKPELDSIPESSGSMSPLESPLCFILTVDFGDFFENGGQRRSGCGKRSRWIWRGYQRETALGADLDGQWLRD